MTCPVCGGKSNVINTLDESDIIFRQRQCKECKYRWYTQETDFDGDTFSMKKYMNKERKLKSEYKDKIE